MAGHTSSSYLKGMLKAGNIRLEMHESTIQPGAEHEAVGTHLHSEIWLVREGTAELTTNGGARTMVAGDVGICCAGGKHYVANTRDKPGTYFLVTVRPPGEGAVASVSFPGKRPRPDRPRLDTPY